jgi:hypothetical protein
MRTGSIRARSGQTYKPSTTRSYEHSVELHAPPRPRRPARRRRACKDAQRFVARMSSHGHAGTTIANTTNPLRAILPSKLVVLDRQRGPDPASAEINACSRGLGSRARQGRRPCRRNPTLPISFVAPTSGSSATAPERSDGSSSQRADRKSTARPRSPLSFVTLPASLDRRLPHRCTGWCARVASGHHGSSRRPPSTPRVPPGARSAAR